MCSQFSNAAFRKLPVYTLGISTVRDLLLVGLEIHARSREPARIWNHKAIKGTVNRVRCSKELRLRKSKIGNGQLGDKVSSAYSEAPGYRNAQ